MKHKTYLGRESQPCVTVQLKVHDSEVWPREQEGQLRGYEMPTWSSSPTIVCLRRHVMAYNVSEHSCPHYSELKRKSDHKADQGQSCNITRTELLQ